MSSPPRSDMSSPSSEEDNTVSLNHEGFTRLSCAVSNSLRAEWPVMSFIEEMHDLWNDAIIEHLDELRDRWFEGVEERGLRPGAVVAREVSSLLKPHGIYISATHPSTQEECPWDVSGPRFYASLIKAARSPSGCCVRGHAPRPPAALSELVWSNADDATSPRITEVGWTLVPPRSDPQMMHQDIVNQGNPRNDRTLGRSRYTHMLWKASADLGDCTTQLVRGGFDRDGQSEESLYTQLGPVGGACLVLDSEVLHRGAGTLAKTTWTSTCTVQLCSTPGWAALEYLVDPKSLQYTLPVAAVDVDCGAGDEGGAGGEGGAAGEVGEVGEIVVAGPTTPRKRRRDDAFSVEVAATDPSDSGTDAGEPLSPLAQELSTVVLLTHEPAAIHAALSRRGFFELHEGLPAAWSSWGVLAFVERCHARWAALVERELTDALNNNPRGKEASSRPGEAAASIASGRLAKHGIAVYVPPPSQSDDPPYGITGPRFYVSITAAAATHFGGFDEMPPMPPSLRRSLWPHADDRHGAARIRGLGWALSPRDADPQALHADLWGRSAKIDRVRFPHLLWKRDRSQVCTTEVVAEGFTNGRVRAQDYRRLAKARANTILVDSEALHRGGSTRGVGGTAAAPDGSTTGWVSSCSVELCSASGWKAWLEGTDGTVADPNDPAYRMLTIREED